MATAAAAAPAAAATKLRLFKGVMGAKIAAENAAGQGFAGDLGQLPRRTEKGSDASYCAGGARRGAGTGRETTRPLSVMGGGSA
ncbi:hypothetical protein GCM10010449_60480 [Streptomyces rectiviolaceus]|uniref:Uncharacterized protein n=1 Tax=Streptomyces rectiviolaceus TaxID=332591 RepID=A0ABP6MZD6_9ACTN